jgi:hypothetical protein
VVALIFTLVFALGRMGNFGDIVSAAMTQANHPYICGSAQMWTGDEARAQRPVAQDVIAANFKNHARALEAFSGLTNQLPAQDRVLLFGDSLLLAMPAGAETTRDKWFDHLQGMTTNVFVAPSNQAVMVRISCVAPTLEAATNIERQLDDYFEFADKAALIPPWSPEAKSADYENGARERHQWKRIEHALAKAWEDPSMTNYEARIEHAAKRGDLTQVKQLQVEQQQAAAEVRSNIVERLRDEKTNPIDPHLLDLHLRLESLSFTNQAARKAIYDEAAPLLGRIAFNGQTPVPGADAYDATSGEVMRKSLMVTIFYMPLKDPLTGLPALADWLCDQHCKGVRYDVIGNADEVDDLN